MFLYRALKDRKGSEWRRMQDLRSVEPESIDRTFLVLSEMGSDPNTGATLWQSNPRKTCRQ